LSPWRNLPIHAANKTQPAGYGVKVRLVRFRRDRWGNLSLDFDIGSIDYPQKAADSK
jgi:hypothetical protein